MYWKFENDSLCYSGINSHPTPPPLLRVKKISLQKRGLWVPKDLKTEKVKKLQKIQKILKDNFSVVLLTFLLTG